MLEKMLEIAKDHNKAYGNMIVRIDMQYNYIDCAWSSRVFYADNHIIDIKMTDEGFKVLKVQ